jgi:hypothetical protein
MTVNLLQYAECESAPTISSIFFDTNKTIEGKIAPIENDEITKNNTKLKKVISEINIAAAIYEESNDFFVPILSDNKPIDKGPTIEPTPKIDQK